MANYKLILKNTTLLAIELDDGLTIPASSQIEVEPSQRSRFIDDIDVIGTLASKIRSGDIVVNDGVDDITTANGFSEERGIDYLKHPDRAFNVRFEAQPERSNGFVSKNVQEAIEEAKAATEGKIAALPMFINKGSTKDKWLSIDGEFKGSDEVPSVTPFDSKFAGLTYVNEDDDSDLDIEFYRNGTSPTELVFTWQIRNKRHAFKTNGLDTIVFSRGDRIHCFARKVTGGTGGKAEHVVVNVIIQPINNILDEGGASTL